jgi:nucleoside-diphosphate-sugar epimerase
LRLADRSGDVGTLLLTGVPGWLSDALLASLRSDPLPGLSHVRCLVRPSDEPAVRAAAARLGFEIVLGDLLDESSLERAVRGVDGVVHAAAIMHVHRIREYYDVNTLGTRNLARAAQRAGVRRFVYLSTNAAAGKSDASDRPLRETDPDKPLSHYGRSKWLGERWLFDVPGDMTRTVLRPCMFYGPPVPVRHVEVYRRIVSGRMPLVGNGDYARSLTHIENLVQGVRLALCRAEAAGQVYNIADSAPYTTRRVVEAMASALGVSARYIRLPAVSASLAYRVDTVLAMLDRYHQTTHLVGEANWNVSVSVEKARADLGYEPTVGLDDGMQGAVRWCREQGLL